MKRRAFLGVAGATLSGTAAAGLLSGKALAATANPAEDVLLALERKWLDAIVRRDEAALRGLMTDDFTRVESPWPRFSMPARQWMAITLHEYRIESFKLLESSVRFSENGAVVASRYRWRGVIGETPLNQVVTAEDAWEQRNGGWRVVRQFVSQAEKVGRPRESARPHKAIALDPAVYRAYVGRYEFGRGRVLTISREGDRLLHQGSGGQRAELLPETETRFFRKDTSVLTIFVKERGRVTHVIHRHLSGRETIGKRVA